MCVWNTDKGTKTDTVSNRTVRKYFKIQIQEENEIKHTAIYACFTYGYQ
jgi:hypothetical protein